MERVTAGVEVDVRFLVDEKQSLVDWIREHHAAFPWMYFEEEIEVAERESHIFVGLFHEGEVVGYIKIGIHRSYVHDFGMEVSFPPRNAFIYDLFVLPEYRARHVALYALTKAMEFLKESGYERVWCHIEEWNRASLRAFGNAGFEGIARIRFCRLLGCRLFIRDGHLPLISFERFLRGAAAAD